MGKKGTRENPTRMWRCSACASLVSPALAFPLRHTHHLPTPSARWTSTQDGGIGGLHCLLPSPSPQLCHPHPGPPLLPARKSGAQEGCPPFCLPACLRPIPLCRTTASPLGLPHSLGFPPPCPSTQTVTPPKHPPLCSPAPARKVGAPARPIPLHHLHPRRAIASSQVSTREHARPPYLALRAWLSPCGIELCQVCRTQRDDPRARSGVRRPSWTTPCTRRPACTTPPPPCTRGAV